MMMESLVFVVLAIVSWRLTKSSYNQLAHFLNAGSDNEAITHESQLQRLIDAAGRYYDERKWLAAEKAYLKVLKLDHKNLTTYRRLGMVYSYLKNYADAAECFELVLKRSPSAADWQNYATVQYHQRRYVAAADALEHALHMENTLARYIALARTWEAAGERTKQLDALLAAQAFAPQDPVVMAQLAQYFEKLNQPGEAKHWRLLAREITNQESKTHS